MFTRMKLENFKSWQSLDIELAPLTLLFGTNSSGKSSILQAILLLAQSQDVQDVPEINFGGENDFVKLGSYRDVVYKHNVQSNFRIALQIEPFYGLLPHPSYEHYFDSSGNFLFDYTFKYNHDDVIVTENMRTRFDIFKSLFERDKPLLNYLAPLRQYPQRTYLWSGTSPRRIEPDGENTIAALIESTRRNSRLLIDVSEWLIKSDLVDEFRVAPLDKDKRFYETLVETGGVESALLDTGFGVSQVLPVVTMLFFAPEGSIVLLEQPELHLHPRAQAHLADLMLHVAEERKLQLIVESHSEHLLRRLQRRIAEQDHEFANPDNIKMYFCDMGENGSTIQPVEVDKYGQIQNWPDKFFGDITGDLEAMTMAALKRSLNGKN